MRELEEATVPHDSKIGNMWQGEFEFVFAARRSKKTTSKPPNGLAVSSDDEVGRKLAESLSKCELAPILASTVVESRIALAGHEVFVVLSNECLADGTYEDIVKLLLRSHTRIPLVVDSWQACGVRHRAQPRGRLPRRSSRGLNCVMAFVVLHELGEGAGREGVANAIYQV